MSPGDEFEYGDLQPCERVGTTAAVSTWIRRRDHSPLTFAPTDSVSIDLADLADKAEWEPKLHVVGDVAGDVAESPCFAQLWKSIFEDGARRVYAPAATVTVDRLVITLVDLQRTKKVEAVIGIDITIGTASYHTDLRVDLSPELPSITTFRARPSIVVTRSKVIEFSVQCERTSSLKITKVGRSEEEVWKGKGGSAVFKTNSSGLPPGLHRYRLTAGGEGGEKTADLLVKLLDTRGWISGPDWWSPGQAAGLCVSPGGETIYALVRYPPQGDAKDRPTDPAKGDASVWWSADGFGRWEELARAPGPPKFKQRMITTAPAVCFRSEKGLGLVFAGGSKVDPMQVSNRVWILDVRAREWSSFDADWPPRMGHACVVATDETGTERIWVIGGADKNGNALADVWTSANGRTWEEHKAPPPWPRRCIAAAAVRGASEIWLGGGFEQPDGKAVNDIWTWDVKKGTSQPLKAGSGHPMELVDQQSDLAALALTTLDNMVYVAGVKRVIRNEGVEYKTTFSPMTSDNSPGFLLPTWTSPEDWSLTAESSRIESVAFNGCIWLFAQRSLGGGRIKGLDLFYSLPPARGTEF